MDLHQEDIDVVQAMSLLAAKFGFSIAGMTRKQNVERLQLEFTGPDENKVAFAEAANEFLNERGKTV